MRPRQRRGRFAMGWAHVHERLSGRLCCCTWPVEGGRNETAIRLEPLPTVRKGERPGACGAAPAPARCLETRSSERPSCSAQSFNAGCPLKSSLRGQRRPPGGGRARVPSPGRSRLAGSEARLVEKKRLEGEVDVHPVSRVADHLIISPRRVLSLDGQVRAGTSTPPTRSAGCCPSLARPETRCESPSRRSRPGRAR